MKGVILKYGIVASLVIGSGAALMNISQHVQRAEREIKSYDRKIASSQESIRVLKAEWAYLNNPARLELLASQGLGLVPPRAMDIISDISSPKSTVFIPTPPLTPSSRSSLHRDISHNISYVPHSRANSLSNSNNFIDNGNSINKDGGAQ